MILPTASVFAFSSGLSRHPKGAAWWFPPWQEDRRCEPVIMGLEAFSGAFIPVMPEWPGPLRAAQSSCAITAFHGLAKRGKSHYKMRAAQRCGHLVVAPVVGAVPCPLRLSVRTPGFQPGKRSSILLGGATAAGSITVFPYPEHNPISGSRLSDKLCDKAGG